MVYYIHTLVLSMFMHLYMLFNLWEVTADIDIAKVLQQAS